MKPASFHILILWLSIIAHSLVYAQQDYIMRINCGSQSSVVYQDKVFEADVNLPGVVEFDSDSTYTSTYLDLPGPFKTMRFTKAHAMHYRFYVPDGIYVVKLYFAESYYGLAPNTDPNLRDFDVHWEEDALLSSLKINGLAGGSDKVYVLERKIPVTDGELSITFEKGQGGEPMINAIEVLGVDAKASEAPAKLLFVYDAAGNQIIRGPEEPASDTIPELEEEFVYHDGQDPKEDQQANRADIFKESIKIFPNPTEGHLTIHWAELPETELIDIKVSDIGNRTVPINFETSYTTARLNLHQHPSGMYVITFYLSDGNTVVEKILKK